MTAARSRKYFTGEMPLRSGDHKPTEKLAKDLAGGVGRHDNQEWIPPTKTRIVYPESKKRQTKIPLEFDWSPFKQTRSECYPVCRHTADQCPTKPEYPAKSLSAPPIPNPEGHRMPEGSVVKVINKMTFDEQPWLDSAPIDVQAKAGHTNFSNDHVALVKAFEKGLFKTDDRGRWYREGWGPGERQSLEDRKHRKAGPQKAADASQPPTRAKDSLASLRGRRCRNCLRRVPEDEHGRVRYCSERCRNRAENARRSDRKKAGKRRQPQQAQPWLHTFGEYEDGAAHRVPRLPSPAPVGR